MNHKLVSERAFKIWEETKNPDSVANWYEALRQLRNEAKVHSYYASCCPDCLEIYTKEDNEENPPTPYDLGHPCDFCGQ